MNRLTLTLVCCVAVFPLAVCAPSAWSDMLPTHGAVVHLDSAPVAGWPVPPAFAPPLAGQVVAGDGNVPDNEYHVLGPIATSTHLGFDNLTSPSGWHWEFELDFDPYLNANVNPFIAGVVGVVFDFSLMGGPILGPVLVGQAVGPEIYIDVDQQDLASGGETGIVTKTLVNATPWVVAWGTSVTEDLFGEPPTFTRKEIHITGVNDPIVIVEPLGVFNQWDIDWNGVVIIVRQTPEPSSVALLAIGGVFVIGVIRHRRRRK